jgi:signal transduction histidine kinase
VDQGPGISAEDQAKLFQRFTKLTARPTGGESSNGLGLSIVKRLVEAMDGRISCRSQLGQGTTFVFALPREVSINEVATPAPTSRAVPERRATSRGATVEWSAAPSS